MEHLVDRHPSDRGVAGLAGRMSITIDGGKHSYAFEYTLPDASR